MFIVPITRLERFTPMNEAAEAAQEKGTVGSVNVPFADILKESVETFESAQKASSKDAYDLSMGTVDDLAGVMINSLKMSTAVELTTQLTSRAVSAYKEIMQTQV